MDKKLNSPERQHFIPKSYLSNFSEVDGDNYFIWAKNKGEDKIKRINTKLICVDKNLYTLPERDGVNKFAIEHFYADNIDAKFPKVYKILTNRDILEITPETKLEIISVALSLYFRTPKFLNQENKLFEELIQAARRNSKGRDIVLDYGGEMIIITPDEVDQVIKEQRENNRIKFLSQHLEAYEAFVNSKLKDGISIYHIIDDSELITSDNPVIIRPYADPTDKNFDAAKYYAQDINQFDKGNTIHVPLDNKTILTILPNQDGFPDLEIRRLDKLKIDTILYNHDIERYAERWILGSEKSIQNHINDQIEFDKPTVENISAVEEYIERAVQFKELTELLERFGTKNKEVLEKAMYMATLNSVNKDPNFDKLFNKIKSANQ